MLTDQAGFDAMVNSLSYSINPAHRQIALGDFETERWDSRADREQLPSICLGLQHTDLNPGN